MVLLLSLAPASAQLAVGSNLNLTMGASLSFDYAGSSSNDGGSGGHGVGFGANSQINGYYYNPQFISFSVVPYYNRSQSEAVSQYVTNDTGVNGSVNFFSGSRFPGSVSFGKTFNNTGDFAIPGISGIKTNGSDRNFGINWSALLPGLPTLFASYTTDSNTSSVYGTGLSSDTNMRNLHLRSDYMWDGFQLNGFYGRQWTQSKYPELLTNGQQVDTTGQSDGYGAGVSHKIPFNGYWSANATRSDFSYQYRDSSAASTSDTFTTSVVVSPTRKLTIASNLNYYDNLFGHLQEQIASAGGAVTGTANAQSHEIFFKNDARYTVCKYLSVQGSVTHQDASFAGQNYAVTQYSGGANFNYNRGFLGSFTLGISAVDSATQQGNDGTGVIGNINFGRRVGRWDIGASFAYSQNVSTMLVIYTTSSYNYGANLRRRFGHDLYWSGSFNGGRSGFSQQAGASSHTEGLASSMSYRRYSVSASYSESAGTAVFTPTGLVAVSGDALPLITNTVLYNARSLGIGGSYNPIRKMTITAAYSKAVSDATSKSSATTANTSLFNAAVRWRLRQLNVDANFTRFEQGFSTSSSRPVMLNSYSLGISRWFNVF